MLVSEHCACASLTQSPMPGQPSSSPARHYLLPSFPQHPSLPSVGFFPHLLVLKKVFDELLMNVQCATLNLDTICHLHPSDLFFSTIVGVKMGHHRLSAGNLVCVVIQE